MSEQHLHTSMDAALAAVRERPVENARREAEERVARDAELLLERPETPEAPPRTGPRKGEDRSSYDAKRNNWRRQVQSKVIDEETDPARRFLLEAYEAIMRGDREGFAEAMGAALAERAREVISAYKAITIVDLLSAGATEEEPEETEEE
jgi:hypothetical protein